jgi:hypothetical protein
LRSLMAGQRMTFQAIWRFFRVTRDYPGGLQFGQFDRLSGCGTPIGIFKTVLRLPWWSWASDMKSVNFTTLPRHSHIQESSEPHSEISTIPRATRGTPHTPVFRSCEPHHRRQTQRKQECHKKNRVRVSSYPRPSTARLFPLNPLGLVNSGADIEPFRPPRVYSRSRGQ